MPCARGAKRSASRPSSDRAGGCFRVAMKASPLLRAWLRRLDAAGVTLALRHAGPAGTMQRRPHLRRAGRREHASSADATVLALGGASWPRLGSDGAWVELLDARRRRGRAAAAGQLRIPRRAGRSYFAALRRAAAEAHRAVVRRARRCAARRSSPRTGLEGGAIYALSRAAARRDRRATAKRRCSIDLRPDMTAESSNAGSTRRAASNRSRPSCARR